MKKTSINGLDLWQFDSLSQEGSIQHFVTDRKSLSRDDEFTLSLSSHPDKTFVQQNRNSLATALGVADSRLYFPAQVHKTRIVRVTVNTTKNELLETDALVTNEHGVGIAVMSADCVPILLYDEKNNAVAAVHSGWRGTVAKILEKTLKEMQHQFGTEGQDLWAGIGPSVSQDSYEVGEEVVREVAQRFGQENDLLIPTIDNKAKLDLWKANKLQLVDFGVSPSRIEISGLCTIKNNNYFFSARKGDTGRFAAGISLKN
jgi:YfiH family protein